MYKRQALDGAFLRCIKEELEGFLSDARVDKIHQPSKEELILTLRQRSGAYKMCIRDSACVAEALKEALGRLGVRP